MTDRSRWRRALYTGAVLVGGALVPSPFARHEAFRYVGPDKWLHAVGHGVFAATLADAVGGEGVSPPAAGGIAAGGSLSVGLAVGYLQQYVPGRAAEFADLVAAALGSVVGVSWWYRAVRTR